MPNPDRQAEQPPTRRAALVRFTKAGAGLVAARAAGIALGTLVPREILKVADIQHGCVISPCRVEADDKKPDTFPLKDGSGWHFTDPTLEFYVYPEGYSVRNQLWSVRQAHEELGNPLSIQWQEDDNLLQAFQGAVVRVVRDQTGNAVTHFWEPIFDRLSLADRDSYLEAEFGIPPLETGLLTKQTEADRSAILNQLPSNLQTAIQTPNWEIKYGLPRVYQDGVLRTPTAVLKLNEAGQVSLVKGGEILKQKTDGFIIPTEALMAELSDRWHEHVFPFLTDPGPSRLPENIIGSDTFVSKVSKILQFIASKSPTDYDFIVNHIYQIREVRPAEREGISVYSKITYLSVDGLSDTDFGLALHASGVYHEATHSYLHDIGRKSGGKYGELACIKAQVEFMLRIGSPPISNKNLLRVIENIDDPSVKWWH